MQSTLPTFHQQRRFTTPGSSPGCLHFNEPIKFQYPISDHCVTLFARNKPRLNQSHPSETAVLVDARSVAETKSDLYMLSSSLQTKLILLLTNLPSTTTYRDPLRIAVLTSTEHLTETRRRAASACRAFNVISEST
jgi:hypothetical protein